MEQHYKFGGRIGRTNRAMRGLRMTTGGQVLKCQTAMSIWVQKNGARFSLPRKIDDDLTVNCRSGHGALYQIGYCAASTGDKEMKLDVGIHQNVPELVYHADPAVEISASASILKTLLDRSPLHAFTDHPRLNPAVDRGSATDAQINGTILHSLILGTPEPHTVLDFQDYRTKEAKAARDVAFAAGFIPILAHKMESLYPVADALRATLQRDHPCIWEAMTDAATQREVTMIWREDGAMCRCRFDALPPASYGFTADLKFTGRSAEPEDWSRKLREDYLFQGALYPMAVKALRGDEPEFLFVVCETDAPYGVSVHAMGPELVDIAKRRVRDALAAWSRCLVAKEWPGYPNLIHYAEAPAWFAGQEESRQAQREYVDQIRIDTIRRIAEQLGGPIS